MWTHLLLASCLIYFVGADVAPVIDVDQLYHSNKPTLSSDAAGAGAGGADVTIDQFDPFIGTRHDEFDWLLTRKLTSTSTENTVLSPFLVKLLLSILAEAAGPGTSTHRQLLTVLPSIRTQNETRMLYGTAFGSLLKGSSDYELNLGARLYITQAITPHQKFASIIKSFYHSDVVALDFSRAQESANLINAWCAEATKNHIQNIVTPDDVNEAVVLLINTIYFSGYWAKPFDEKDTAPQNFFLTSKTPVNVPFMKRTDDFYYTFSEDLNAQILRIPYKGLKFAMYIVLPVQADGITELAARVDSSALSRARITMELSEVKVALPKFRFENSVRLNEALKALGIQQIFSSQASLPQLARGVDVANRLQVSSVYQKTGIEVNERGSTAYAATIASLVNKFGGDIEFKADHPFLFFIEDETTGTLLFTGKVMQPQ